MPIHPKVAASGAAGAVVTLIIYGASFFNVEVPGEVAAALTVLISSVAGWLKSAKADA